MTVIKGAVFQYNYLLEQSSFIVVVGKFSVSLGVFEDFS